jgi:hypothetical protein
MRVLWSGDIYKGLMMWRYLWSCYDIKVFMSVLWYQDIYAYVITLICMLEYLWMYFDLGIFMSTTKKSRIIWTTTKNNRIMTTLSPQTILVLGPHRERCVQRCMPGIQYLIHVMAILWEMIMRISEFNLLGLFVIWRVSRGH